MSRLVPIWMLLHVCTRKNTNLLGSEVASAGFDEHSNARGTWISDASSKDVFIGHDVLGHEVRSGAFPSKFSLRHLSCKFIEHF